MKEKIAAFLVRRSKFILVLFIAAAIGCLFLIPQVNVNYDMTKYLPKDSSMKQGLDIMEAEFGEEMSSNLQVMFDDLTSVQEKAAIREELEQIPNVADVDYDLEDEDYNRGKYTLYIVNCDEDQYSEEAAGIWNAVREMYEEDHQITLSGTIYDANKTGLPLWIALCAVGFVVLIMFIMANSCIEPVAFLITIGVAVAINMGTYVLFPSISDTTFSIVALLQLVLSMDYSIMLLNRYRQQRLVTPDKYRAMQDSLALSFGSITGSSLTTFAGLLALLFMSFRIGPDIGLALAKGVLVSLICIFTVLPAVLLGFDSLMIRTAKRSFSPNMEKLGRFQFRFAVPITIAFVMLFALGFYVRNSADFSYSQSMGSDIERIFGYNNTIIMIYNVKDAEAAGELAEALDDGDAAETDDGNRVMRDSASAAADGKNAVSRAASFETAADDRNTAVRYEGASAAADGKHSVPQAASFETAQIPGAEKVRSAVCYESTLGKLRTAESMEEFIDDVQTGSDADEDSVFGSDGGGSEELDLDLGMLKLIYFDRFGDADEIRFTIPGFVEFLDNEILDDENFEDQIDTDARDQIDDMKKFTDPAKLTRKMSIGQLAEFFDMKRSDAGQLLLYYYIRKGGMNTGRMTLPAFVGFLIDDVAKDSRYSSMFGKDELQKLKQMRVYTNKKKMTRKVSYEKAAGILGMDSDQMRGICLNYQLKRGIVSMEETETKRMSITGFADTLEDICEDPVLKDQFPREQMQPLIQGLQQIGQMDLREFTPAELMDALTGYGMPLEDQLILTVYTYHLLQTGDKAARASVQKIVRYICRDKTIRGSMSKKQRKQMNTLRRIIDTSVKGRKLSVGQMASLLGMKKPDVKKIYLFYDYMHGRTAGWGLSPQRFIAFLADDVLGDPELMKENGDQLRDSADDLRFARKLIDHVVKGTKFTWHGLADFLRERPADDGDATGAGDAEESSADSNDANGTGSVLDDDSIRVIYEYYGSKHRYDDSWEMSLVEMVHFLDEEAEEDTGIASLMEAEDRDDIRGMREDLDEAAELLEGEHYGRMIVTADLEEDSDATRAFMRGLDSARTERFENTSYMVGATPMAYEMSRSFRKELDKITLVTALFIFLIVLLTFRRVAIPAILVLVIQCAVFLTMGIMSAVDIDMNYLALLIVQSIMMGATIDYAIIYTTYYLESRQRLEGPPAITAAFRGSLQTILTSSLMLIVAVGILSFAFQEEAVRQICRILSVGCLVATLLIILVLPGILICLDRLVRKRT